MVFEETVLAPIGIFVGTLVFLKLFEVIVMIRFRRLAKKTKTDLDDVAIEVIEQLGWPFYLVASIAATAQFSTLPPLASRAVSLISAVVFVYYLVISLQKIFEYPLKRHSDPLVSKVLSNVFKVVLWIGAVVILLQNFGVNVTALVGGLGIGGLAVAFALQNILGDILAYFSIHFDKPFQEGDFIMIGDDLGTVQKIGLRSTRIKVPQGEELVIPNRELTETRVKNFKKLEKRRVTFNIGVTYETPVSKLKKIPEMIKGIIRQEKLADTERVFFTELGDSALVFEVVYYIKSSDYRQYRQIQQSLNLKILENFEKERIDIAYPTQKIFLSTPPEKTHHRLSENKAV